MVVAMQRVSEITTVGLIMSLPAGLGYWLDSRWGTLPWLISLGGLLGFIAGMFQLLQTFNRHERSTTSRRDAREETGRDNPGDGPS